MQVSTANSSTHTLSCFDKDCSQDSHKMTRNGELLNAAISPAALKCFQLSNDFSPVYTPLFLNQQQKFLLRCCSIQHRSA